MIVLTLIEVLLGIPALWLALRYNMHMFQLNTYMNNEQREWLKRNRHLQWILDFAVVLGIVRIAGPLVIPQPWFRIVGDILVILTFIVIILVYRLMVEMNSKKPLKFTPRVKRMIASDIVLCVLLFVIPVGIVALMGLFHAEVLKWFPFGAFLLFLTGMQKELIMDANKVNRPIEKGVNNHYINDAKRILRENPDLTIIGVTGSYGKTSVKFYLETLLRQKYRVLVTPESYNTPMGIVITIRKFLKPTHEIFVCEMGARYAGEIKEDCDLVHPHHGLITSIGPQHLDTF